MANYEMHALQQHILKMLLDFDKICSEHDLHYYVVFGTMLGAVRHKGFIPWDDDIDVAFHVLNTNCLLPMQVSGFLSHMSLYAMRPTSIFSEA